VSIYDRISIKLHILVGDDHSSNEFLSHPCDLKVEVTIQGQRSNIRKQLLVITLVSSFMIGFPSNLICGLGMAIARTSSWFSHVTSRSTSPFTVKGQISVNNCLSSL
ncbi:hypothetical protein ScPMuIL_005876, partial [Solemya velum]